MKLNNRLNAHFAACAAVAATAVVAAPQQADAAVVYSGVVNINIPYTTAGVYLNVETGVNNPSPGLVPGWDVNPFSASGLSFFAATPSSGSGTIVNAAGGASATLVDNLAAGFLINGTSTYGANNAAETTGANAFNLSSSNNIAGFRFTGADALIHFGWMRISVGSAFNSTGGARSIVEYAYENVAGTGIAAGDTGVPAPGAIALLGMAGLIGSRRRRVA